MVLVGTPSRYTKWPIDRYNDFTEQHYAVPTSGSGAAVARLLAKEKVEGSNPFFRSRQQPSPASALILIPGDVAKW